MKHMGRWRHKLFLVAEWVYAGSSMLAASMGVILSLGSDEHSDYFKEHPIHAAIVDTLKEWAIPLYALIGLVVVLCFIVRRMGDPWIYDKVQFILDGYRAKCFAKFDGNKDPHDHHRVTLFKACTCINDKWRLSLIFRNPRPLFCTYLIPVRRSGHMSQKSQARFYVSDESNDVEGLAGLAWSMNSHIVKGDLPDLTVLYSGKKVIKAQQDALMAGYTAETNCSESMINSYISRDRHLPRSIGATTVLVKNKLWGVLVVDSRRPDGVLLESISNYALTVSVIGELLERA